MSGRHRTPQLTKRRVAWSTAAVAISGTIVALGPGQADAALPPECSEVAGVVSCVYTAHQANAFTVPPGISTVHVFAVGGKGYAPGPARAGYGGRVGADLPTTPGATLYAVVGGNAQSVTGGFNGGANGGSPTNGGVAGGGGGGASDVRTSASVLASRLIVAAGGGGAANGDDGGSGGDAERAGENGRTVSGGLGGRPGTQTQGGAGGAGFSFPQGRSGVFGNGGAGAASFSNSSNGGGGGGGWYGGGGGGASFYAFSSAGGGGGGSNHTDSSATNVISGVDSTGEPRIVISYLLADLGISGSASPNPVPYGEYLTYRVDVTSDGPGTATNVRLVQTLPTSGQFDSLFASAGWTCSAPPYGNTGTVRCKVASVSVGTRATLLVRVLIVSTHETVSSTATVSADTGDQDPSDNTVTITTSVGYSD